MNDIIQRLKSDGFEGFISVEDLMQSRKMISSYSGVYIILRLKDSRELLVCWKETDENPRVVEEEMIAQFKKEHGGKRPFANLQD